MATEGGGGDWDRRNRLKVYRGLQRFLERDIKGAAALLIDCIATFSCNEICSYQDFIMYAIMSNLLHLPRPQIKEKILDGPEILSVANDIPVVVSSCGCREKEFILESDTVVHSDRLSHPRLFSFVCEQLSAQVSSILIRL